MIIPITIDENGNWRKNEKGLEYIGFAIVFGSIATLISGLYARDLPRRIGLHVTAHGFPLTWVKRFVPAYPDKPTRYLLCPEGLFTDIAFWSLVVGIPLSASIAIYKRYRSRK